jgi:hypothetical protein
MATKLKLELNDPIAENNNGKCSVCLFRQKKSNWHNSHTVWTHNETSFPKLQNRKFRIFDRVHAFRILQKRLLPMK